MADLSSEESHRYWHEHPDPWAYRAIAALEGVEDWTLDSNPEMEIELDRLGQLVEAIGKVDIKDEVALIQLLVQIKAGRALRLLKLLDIATPGAAAKLLRTAQRLVHSDKEESADGEIFLRRSIVFERLRILGRVFSETRLTEIANILNEANVEE